MYQLQEKALLRKKNMIWQYAKLKKSNVLVTKNENRVLHPLQLKKSEPDLIEEGDWAHVSSGGTLTFSKLSAGCLAVVVNFEGGGGAGVHLALNMDKEQQWTPFKDAIAGKRIKDVVLYSDIAGTPQGWYVLSKYDADYLPRPETERNPISYGEYQALCPISLPYVWEYSSGSLQEWFKAALGASTSTLKVTQDVAHKCT